MRLKVLKLRRLEVDDELYEEVTEHGYHPSNNQIQLFYKEMSPITVNVHIGDIFEVDGIRYFYAPSGIEVHEPVVREN